jgi:hypothetical protein
MSYDLPGTIERMTLSAMPLGLQCAPWKWKFVWLNWCGCEGLLGRISRLGGRSLISRIFRVSPGFMRSVGPSPPS